MTSKQTILLCHPDQRGGIFAKRNKLLIIFTIILNFSFGSPQILTLSDFLQQAKTENLTFKQILLDELTISANTLSDADIEEIIFSLEAGYSLFLSNSNSNAPSYGISLSKLFPKTATEIETSFAENLSGTIKQDTFSFGITQPLIQNAMGYQNNLEKENLLLTEKITRLSILEAYEEHFSTLINLYYDWYLSFVEKNAAEEQYKKYDQLLKDILKRQKNHIATEIDVNKIKVQILDKRENLFQKKQNFLNDTKKIETILGVQFTEQTLPSFPAEYPSPKFDSKVVKNRALEIIDLTKKQKANLVLISEDSLRPPLDVEINYTKKTTQGGSSSDSEKIVAGISLQFPYATSQEKAKVDLAKTTLKDYQYSHDLALKALSEKIDILQKNIEVKLKLKDLYTKKSNYLKQIAKAEKEEYLSGRSSLNEYIGALNSLDSANAKLLALRIEIEKLKVSWYELVDGLYDTAPNFANHQL